MTPDRVTLARLATTVADEAAACQQWALAGLLRQLARAVVEPARVEDRTYPVRCGWCNQPLTGRQRAWCSDACRTRAARRDRVRPGLVESPP
jgi:hypothetical protein